MSNYRIGTYAWGVTGIADLCNYVGSDPEPVSFQEFSEVVGQDMNGANIEAGLPRASWHWDSLSQTEFDALMDFVSNGASASVYVRTRKNSGAVLPEWGTFLAVMQRPQSMTEGRIVHRDVTVDFVAMVAQ